MIASYAAGKESKAEAYGGVSDAFEVLTTSEDGGVHVGKTESEGGSDIAAEADGGPARILHSASLVDSFEGHYISEAIAGGKMETVIATSVLEKTESSDDTKEGLSRGRTS